MIEPNYTYKAVVSKIVDGDTLDVAIDVGFRSTRMERLRLNRVNTSEVNAKDPSERARAQAAKDFVNIALADRRVMVRTQKSDAFGRYLADVFYVQEGVQKNLNDELLALGLARPYVRD